MIHFKLCEKRDIKCIKNLAEIYDEAMKILGVRIWKEEEFLQLLERNFLIFYVEVNLKILGFIVVKIIKPEAEIINISVKPNYQRTGLGKKLFTFMISSDLFREVKQILLEVSSGYKKAIKFYKNLGFKIITKRKKYYNIKGGPYSMKDEDADIMKYFI